jgi:hypothetical protein
MVPPATKYNARLLLFLGLAAAIYISVYPIGMIFSVPIAHVFEYARHDLAWSFHSLFLIPIAFGLLVISFYPKLFLGVSVQQRAIWLLLFIVFVTILSWGAVDDKQMLWTPDRISRDGDYQQTAIEVDECLRRLQAGLQKHCLDEHNNILDIQNLKNCREKYASSFPALRTDFVSPKLAELVGTDHDPLLLPHGYLCALLKKSGGVENSLRGPMFYIVLVLKIILIIFVGLFVLFTAFVCANWYKTVELKTLYALLGCYVILLTWFPLQLYAEWHQWYGDLEHINQLSSFKGLLAVAVVLFVVFGSWIAVRLKGADFITAMGGVPAVVAAATGLLGWLKPEALKDVFGRFEGLDTPVFLALVFVVLLYIAVYVRLLMTENVPDTSTTSP